jgi:starch synthase
MVSSEAAPLAKTGGLADVVGILPDTLRARGDQVAVVIPRYGSIDLKQARRVYDHLRVYLGPVLYETSIYQAPAAYPLYLVDCPPLFDRPGLYGESGVDYPDNHLRFAVLARAAISIARYLFRTEIFHCHDWQSGLVPAYLHTLFASDPTFLGAKTLFTIHNLGYQGLFPLSALSEIGLSPAAFRPDGMEFFGRVSYIKGGISFADALTTVSPTYAREIQTPEFGFGLDGALSARAGDLSGILNGVDYSVWDPETDPLIPAHYSASDLAGKRACKKALLKEFSLPAKAIDRPLFGIVSRFTRQKGSDLLSDIVPEIVGGDAYLVALGTGDSEYENLFRSLAAGEPGRIGVRIGFDDRLAHLIEAGADIFLMPSRYEPCGLNQIYSLRYGTVPVVRATGGLVDTVFDLDNSGRPPAERNGFVFHHTDNQAIESALSRALRLWSACPGEFRRLAAVCMRTDYSWARPGQDYLDIYHQIRRT